MRINEELMEIWPNEVCDTQLITDVVRNGILHHFSECSVILTDPVLKLGKLDEVVDSLAVIWKRDCNDSVLVIIIW